MQPCSTRRWRQLAWLAACILALLQAHFYLKGFRLTGDDVLFESVVLHHQQLSYAIATAHQHARIGDFLLMPLNLLGSHYASLTWFRELYVLGWFAAIVLFANWFGRIVHRPIALPLFVAIVAMQPLIGFHMPPIGYPLQLTVPLLILLAIRLSGLNLSEFAAGQFAVYARWPVRFFYLLALISQEYMMIFGGVIVLLEMIATLDSRSPRQALSRHRWDVITLVIVFAAYALFRFTQPTHYEGAGMDGLSNGRELLHTLLMHIASGTWLPYTASLHIDHAALPGIAMAALSCAVSLIAFARSRPCMEQVACTKPFALSIAGVLGALALTLPVVASSQQQIWCSSGNTCAWLDSRLSLLLLAASLMVLLPWFSTRRSLLGTSVIALSIAAGACFAISRQQAMGVAQVASAWQRARQVACHRPALDPDTASHYIDPHALIPMHVIMDRSAFWRDYDAYLAAHDRCVQQVSVAPYVVPRTLVTGVPVQTNDGNGGAKLLVAGWGTPESSGTWTVGPQATIDVQVPAGSGLQLNLELGAYAPHGVAQEVLATINGVGQTRWRVIPDGTHGYVLPLPDALTAHGGSLHISLRIVHPISPLVAGQSSDPRALGVMLYQLQLQQSH